ncbi:hypothetical protein A9Q84_18250 [Halobacteriovorax marinus]|uniref:Periplasmic binding protein domain-containing protein n=1 Tax=Halobacteriovorax marinus TaxID=97084 RepID=A0A1Y5F9H2_9BACT|nr:hypothetical protein A9Q84_18250 [Halobacteriovorax marinus]
MKMVIILCVLSLMIPSVQSAEDCIFVSVGKFHAFWKSVSKGAYDSATKQGLRVYERSVSKTEDGSVNKEQIKVLNWNKSKVKCRGIVLAPMDFKIKSVISQLKNENYHIMYVDRDDGTNSTIGSIVTNNFKVGEIAAEKMVKKIGTGIAVAVFKMAPNVKTTGNRVDGFTKRAKELGLEVIVSEFIGDRYKNAQMNSTTLLKENPQIKGIFTPNETTTLGTYISLKDLNLKRITLIGVDINERVYEGLKDGYIYGSILQDPYGMGHRAVEYLKRAMEGEVIRKQVNSEAYFLSRENIKKQKSLEMLKGYGVKP